MTMQASNWPTNEPISFWPLPDGAPGTRETLKLMRDWVRKAKLDPEMRLRALDCVRNLIPKDWVAEIEACFDYVQTHIRYTLDINGMETLQEPWLTFRLGAGDCDDMTMALCALLEILGHPCYICAAGFDEVGYYSHVFLLCDPAGEGNIVALDATEFFPPGWGPPGAQGFMIAPIEE